MSLYEVWKKQAKKLGTTMGVGNEAEALVVDVINRYGTWYLLYIPKIEEGKKNVIVKDTGVIECFEARILDENIISALDNKLPAIGKIMIPGRFAGVSRLEVTDSLGESQDLVKVYKVISEWTGCEGLPARRISCELTKMYVELEDGLKFVVKYRDELGHPVSLLLSKMFKPGFEAEQEMLVFPFANETIASRASVMYSAILISSAIVLPVEPEKEREVMEGKTAETGEASAETEI